MKKLTKKQKESIVQATIAIADLNQKYEWDKKQKQREFIKTCQRILEQAIPLRTKFKKRDSRLCFYNIDPNATYMILKYHVTTRQISLAEVRPEEFLRRHASFLCKKIDKRGRPNGYGEQIWLHHFEQCCEIVK